MVRSETGVRGGGVRAVERMRSWFSGEGLLLLLLEVVEMNG